MAETYAERLERIAEVVDRLKKLLDDRQNWQGTMVGWSMFVALIKELQELL